MQCLLKTAVNGEKEVIIDFKSPLGKGAQATVYKSTVGGIRYAAKIFHQQSSFDDKKIVAMIANPPERLEGLTAGILYPRYSWPLSIIIGSNKLSIGYLMPLIDQAESFTLDHYYDKNLGKKLNSPDEVALSYKLEVATNLSSLVADLHSHGHFFIDFKPQNIRVFKRTHAVTLIDCDGFAIESNAGKRYPAELLSTDYISPEAFRNKSAAKDLDINQDRYALATIIFQLLNGGIHPFQGIPTGSLNAATNDEKAALGLYPHGLVEDLRIHPRPQSVHLCFDDVTRALFDRAFIGPPDARPSAEEWAKHLTSLLDNKQLTRCEKNPYDIRHMRFLNKECPECLFQEVKAQRNNTKKKKTTIDFNKLNQGTGSVHTQQNSSPKSNLLLSVGMYLFVGILLFVSVVAILKETNKAPANISTSVGEQYKNILTDKYLSKLNKIEEISTTTKSKSEGGHIVNARASKYYVLAWTIIGARDTPYYPLAFRLNTQAYDLGHPEGASNLGYMYEFGMGVQQDFQKAAKWYRKAIEMGQPHSAQAELRLGNLIANNKIPSNTRVREARMYFEAGIEVANNGNWKDLKSGYLKELGDALNRLNQPSIEAPISTPSKQLSSPPSSSGLQIQDLSIDEKASLESACNQDKTLGGPNAYTACADRNLKLLAIGPRLPTLSTFDTEKRANLEAACSQEKYLKGPAAYAKCIRNQLDQKRQ